MQHVAPFCSRLSWNLKSWALPKYQTRLFEECNRVLCTGRHFASKMFPFYFFQKFTFFFSFYFFYLGCCNLSCAEFEGLWYLKVTFVPACHLISGGITVFCASLSKVLALGISIAQCVWRHICWSPGCAACVWSPKWRYGELDLGQ